MTTLRLIGAGLPRTGTSSLRTALTTLLDAPCHHMHDFFHRPERSHAWAEAFAGRPDWDVLLDGYAAGVDSPVCAFWEELAATYPDAVVLLSHRDSAETWRRSVDATVLNQVRAWHAASAPGARQPTWLTDASTDQRAAIDAAFGWLLDTFGTLDDPAVLEASYDAWLDHVRATVSPVRLVEWQPGDGWGPLCAALDVPVPDAPFPHENSTAAFLARKSRAT